MEENGPAAAAEDPAGVNGAPRSQGRRGRKRRRPQGGASMTDGDGGGEGGEAQGLNGARAEALGSDGEEEQDEGEEEGDEDDEAAQRRRREELGEEDEEEGAPLVAAGEVGANLRVWARRLERPPKGNLRSYSEGLWRPEKQLCRIIKPRGNDLRCMGFALDGDVHLYPEETLFLVERCKLEVGNLSTPQLYESVDLGHYLAYAYFKQTSLIVFRAEPAPPVEEGGEPVPPPPGVAFEAYAPTGQFSKKNKGRPIMYIMHGGTRAPVPTEAELAGLFEWARGVPLKFAMVSDEGGVFAVNLAPRPLENHTHLRTLKEVAAARKAAQQQGRKGSWRKQQRGKGGGGGGVGGGAAAAEGMDVEAEPAAAGGGEAMEAGVGGGIGGGGQEAQEDAATGEKAGGADEAATALGTTVEGAEEGPGI